MASISANNGDSLMESNVSSDELDSDVESSVGYYETENEEDVKYGSLWAPHTQGLCKIPFTCENKIILGTQNKMSIVWFLWLLDDICLEGIIRETN